jgi:hypothetical protein
MAAGAPLSRSCNDLVKGIKCPFQELDNVRRSSEDSTIVDSKMNVRVHSLSEYLPRPLTRVANQETCLGNLVPVLLESTLS